MPGTGTRKRWGLPLATLAAGIALRDCLVISAAGPLALRAFYASMDENAPMEAIRAAIRSALAGAISMVAAGALALLALAAIHGVWEPVHDRFFAGAWLLAASIAALALSAREESPPAVSWSPWTVAGVALAAGIAMALSTQGLRWNLCAIPLAVSLLMAFAGWRLLREVSPEFLSSLLER